MARRGKRPKPKAKMPPDREIREGLVESWMPEGEAADTVSQLLRAFRVDFFRRRRNRLFNAVQDRLILVAAKTKVLDVLRREASGRRKSFNLGDLLTGIHHTELTNLGEVIVRRAIRELVAEGLVKAGTEGPGMELLGVTGRRPRWRATKLRSVYDRMRLAMGIRGARPYVLERIWNL